MNIAVAYLIYIIALAYLFRKAGVRKLSLPLYVPMLWMLILLSRSLAQWLDSSKLRFGGMEPEMEGNPIDAAVLLLLILIALRILYVRKLDIKGIIKDNRALILLIGFALLSLIWADYPFIGLKRWVRWFGSVVMVLVILSEEDAKEAAKALVNRCAYILIPLSVIFIKFVPKLGRFYNARGLPDYHGVATQKNDYGALLLVCGIHFAWELIVAWKNKDHAKPSRREFINIIFLIVIFWQLLFIDSKTSLICLLLGILMITWLNFSFYQKRPNRARYYLIAFALGAIILQQFFQIDSTIIRSAGRDPTLTGRTELWVDILKVPINPMIGTGWDNFWLGDRVIPLWRKWLWQPRSAHNGYIEIYLCLGGVGIVLLSLVLLQTFNKSAATLAADFQKGCLAFVFFLITLVSNYSESYLHRNCAVWFFFLLFSCLSIPKRSQVPSEKEPISG